MRIDPSRRLLVAALVTAVAAPSVVGATSKPMAAKHVLPFVEDDYGAALAEARAAKKPIFVDAWAPW